MIREPEAVPRYQIAAALLRIRRCSCDGRTFWGQLPELGDTQGTVVGHD